MSEERIAVQEPCEQCKGTRHPHDIPGAYHVKRSDIEAVVLEVLELLLRSAPAMTAVKRFDMDELLWLRDEVFRRLAAVRRPRAAENDGEQEHSAAPRETNPHTDPRYAAGFQEGRKFAEGGHCTFRAAVRELVGDLFHNVLTERARNSLAKVRELLGDE